MTNKSKQCREAATEAGKDKTIFEASVFYPTFFGVGGCIYFLFSVKNPEGGAANVWRKM